MRKVVVTHFAFHQLNSIYDYYKWYASIRIAKKIKSEIIIAIKSLKREEVAWQEDEFLNYLNKKHKRLVCGNYKIIYYVNSTENVLYVTDIFDSRQDPIKGKG